MLTFIFFAGTFGLTLSGRGLDAFEGGIGTGGGGGGGGAKALVDVLSPGRAIAGGELSEMEVFVGVEFESSEEVAFAALKAGAGGGGGGGGIGGEKEEARGREAGESAELAEESRTGFRSCTFDARCETTGGIGAGGAGGAGGGGGGGGTLGV